MGASDASVDGVRAEIVARVLARRGRVRWFDALDPARTALVVIDMQEMFCAEGAPGEVPAARAIAPTLNATMDGLRARGVPVVFVLHANTHAGGRSDWELFFNHVVADEVRARTIESLAPERQAVWSGLARAAGDIVLTKNRYSAFTPGSSSLERVLRNHGVDTVLIAGVKTNICCESTARDAMMLDFKTVMLSDCCAALSPDEHRSALENVFQQFGDVMTGAQALALMDARRNA